MSEKQFNHIDNKIREAAENSEPAFDEHAWTLMEARLDKEDAKKRRYFFWWLALPILIITVGGIYIFGDQKGTEKLPADQKMHEGLVENKAIPQKNAPAIAPALIHATDNVNNDANKLDEQSSPGNYSPNRNILRNNGVVMNKSNNASEKTKAIKGGKLSSKTTAVTVAENDETADIQDPVILPVDEKSVASKTSDDPSVTINDRLSKTDSSKISPAQNITNAKAPLKSKDQKPSRFYFLAALGIDVGSVKLFSYNNSKVTPKYGVGVGYQLNKRFGVQTGFYAVTKKYVAGPGDYYPKYGSYWNMVKLTKVDASCLVYDIPITVRYTISQKPTTAFYATAGISSYIMKQEDYKYYYVRYNMPHEASKTYTGNKDLFSVLNLSAGIEKKLSPQFYLQAEPSIGIPLSGVGEGSVKLYSTSLQIALKYQPVRKRK